MSGSEALQKQLRTEPPAGLDLTDEDQQELADLIARARAAQGAELQESLQAAVEHIPRPLRGTVRRMFGL